MMLHPETLEAYRKMTPSERLKLTLEMTQANFRRLVTGPPNAVPSKWAETSAGFDTIAGPIWYRCVVRLPKSWANAESLRLKIASDEPTNVWLNGHAAKSDAAATPTTHQFSAESLVADDYHLLVLRIHHRHGDIGHKTPPVLVNGSQQFELKGRWQFRSGDDKSWSNIPLPAKFGGSTDMLFEPQ